MFLKPNLEIVLNHLDKLDPDTKPKWGTLSSQGMVEHLTDVLKIASGENKQKLLIPEEKIQSMQRFLDSDKEMMQNISVPFAPAERVLRNDNLSDAIDEFVETWIAFEEHFDSAQVTELHPFYGELDFNGWQKLNSKHLTHHFKQFDLM
ncbi:MAG: DUF1569 domain-containing protein [Brumimicrobium sp.]|nr:DUF1569 domain-containing protein [Brumimicrobium sp.]